MKPRHNTCLTKHPVQSISLTCSPSYLPPLSSFRFRYTVHPYPAWTGASQLDTVCCDLYFSAWIAYAAAAAESLPPTTINHVSCSELRLRRKLRPAYSSALGILIIWFSERSFAYNVAAVWTASLPATLRDSFSGDRKRIYLRHHVHHPAKLRRFFATLASLYMPITDYVV